MKISSEHYVRRKVDETFAARRLERLRKIRDLKFLRLKRARKEKRKELGAWRQRNLDKEDAGDDGEEDEEIGEVPEPVQRADVVADLEGEFDAENGALEAVCALFEEQLIDLITIPGDKSKSTVLASVMEVSAPTLPCGSTPLPYPTMRVDTSTLPYPYPCPYPKMRVNTATLP